jgi:quinol monooxygenase YgiN
MVPNMSHDLQVTLRARPGRGSDLEWLLRDAVEQMGEVQCLELLLIERAPSDPDVVRVTESWTSRAEHEEFAARPDVRALMAHVHALCERPPEIVRTSPSPA